MTGPSDAAPAAPPHRPAAPLQRSRTAARARSGLGLLLAAAIPLAVGGLRYQQGIDLNLDGLWLLGAAALGDGDAPHARLALADGPARYSLLAATFAMLGRSAHALAMLKALLTATFGAMGYHAARRAGAGALAWSAPVAAVAVGPVAPEVFALGLLAWCSGWAARGGSRARWLTVGAAVSALLAFGAVGLLLALGMAAGWGLAAAARPARLGHTFRRVAPMVLVPAIAMLGLLAWAIWRQELGATIWRETVEVPWQDLRAWLTRGGALEWIDTFRSGPYLLRPFEPLLTGEALLEMWRGQSMVRSTAWRVLYVGVGLVPLVGLVRLLWSSRRGAGEIRAHPAAGVRSAEAARGDWMLAIALGACGTGLAVGGGDVLHLAQGSLVASWALPLVLSTRGATIPRSRGRLVGTVAVTIGLALGFGPLAAEQIWLASHSDRPTLLRWDRPRAGILLDSERVEGLERLADTLDFAPDEAALVWPGKSALYFAWNVMPATRQVSLPRRRLADSARVIGDLERTKPRVALLEPWRGNEHPLAINRTLWDYLRTHYSLVGSVARAPDAFRVLQRAAPADIASLPLPQRLPDVELAVGNDESPSLVPGLTVGQTFWVGATDLAGVSVRWRTRGHDLVLPVRVRVWWNAQNDFRTLLAFYDVDVTIPGDGHRSYLSFGPVADSARKELAVTLEVRRAPDSDVRLLWHLHDGGGQNVDLFREGSALVNRQPVPADLYFFSY